MTEDIWINIDEGDTDFFRRMGGKEGKLYVNVGYDDDGTIGDFYMLLYLDGTVSDNYVTVVEKEDKTLKFVPCEKYCNAIKQEFDKRIWESELFCNDEFEGIGEKNMLLHLL